MRGLRKSAELFVTATLALTAPMTAQTGTDAATLRTAPLTLAADYKPLRDPARAPRQLQRVVSLALTDATLADALAALARSTGIRILLGEDVFAYDSRISVDVRLPAVRVLFQILRGTGFEALVSATGEAAVVRRAREDAVQAGNVVGRLTDGKTGSALSGVDVSLEGTRWRTTTGGHGRYRLADITPASYTLVARRIGYGPERRAVTVPAGREVPVDVALHPAARAITHHQRSPVHPDYLLHLWRV